MELVLIGFAALLASGLTLLSGFGLGTALMPVFALFFPLPLAIAATAVVHFANNLFKLGLMAQQANWSVVVKFSVPAAFTAILGAGSLTFFDQLPPLWHYSIAGSSFEITTVKAVIGSLIIGVWGAMEPKTNVSSESHRKGAFRSPAHPPGITL